MISLAYITEWRERAPWQAQALVEQDLILCRLVVDLFSDPGKVAAIRAEFLERRGADFQYRPLLGDRDPPLDYRASVMR